MQIWVEGHAEDFHPGDQSSRPSWNPAHESVPQSNHVIFVPEPTRRHRPFPVHIFIVAKRDVEIFVTTAKRGRLACMDTGVGRPWMTPERRHVTIWGTRMRCFHGTCNHFCVPFYVFVKGWGIFYNFSDLFNTAVLLREHQDDKSVNLRAAIKGKRRMKRALWGPVCRFH